MNIGTKVSQKTYDIKECADRFLTYSSAFRTLKIFKVSSASTTIPTTGNVNTITITNNLGYYAPAIVIYNGSTTIGQNNSYFMTDSQSTLNVKIYTDKIEILVDEFFDEGYSNIGDTVYFTVYSFLDTFDEYTSAVINSDTTTAGSSSDYGIRISKEGFDVKTCLPTQLIVSSSYFANIVQKKGIDTTGTVAHVLGYIPSFLGFYKNSGNSFLSLTDSFGYTGTFSVSTDEITSNLGAGDSFYYVVFKQKLV